MDFRVKSLGETVRDILATLKAGERGQPAYTLLVGSGFSFPVIPTPTQMLRDDIAWWRFWKERNLSDRFPFRSDGIAGRLVAEQEISIFERELWKSVHAKAVQRHADGAFVLSQDGLPDLTLPTNVGLAYQGMMRDGLATDKMRRLYLRDAIGRSYPKINSAHLFLAGILEAQEGWGWRAPFCRTIFTTNFDPLLQRSLQLVNKLYYMTDRPSSLESPDDDETEAIHLIYTHGSVHRYELLNTDDQIDRARERNATSLINYFERHGVLVIGYSGWQDTTMAALLRCASFDSNLYWCDIHSEADAKTRLRPEVIDLLRAPGVNAYYVPIAGADEAMRQLHRALKGRDVPDFIVAPVTSAIAQLKSIEVPSEVLVSTDPDTSPLFGSLKTLLNDTLTRLDVAQSAFDNPSIVQPWSAQAKERIAEASVAQLVSDALIAHSEGRLAEAISLWGSVIAVSSATGNDRAIFFYNRGLASWECGRVAEAINDYTSALSVPGVTTIQRAMALINRGVALRHCGRTNEEINDYTAVVALHDVSAEQAGQALIARACAYAKVARSDEAFKDLAATLTWPGVSTEHRATALLNRGVLYWESGNSKAALEDYDAAIAIACPSVLVNTKALINRGLAYRRRGQINEAIADYTTVIEMTEVPLEQKVGALLNRAAAYGLRAMAAEAIEDCAHVIGIPDVPVAEKVRALVNRGVAYSLIGNIEASIKDDTAVVAISDAPAESRAMAFVNRGISHLRGGNTSEALTDFDAAIAMPDAPAEQRAKAFVGQGEAHVQGGSVAQALSAYASIVAMSEAPPSLKARALVNRGWQLFTTFGDVHSLISDSRGALELCPSDASARMNLALGLLLDGKLEKARIEYNTLVAQASNVSIVREAINDLSAEVGKRPDLPGAMEILEFLRNAG